MQHAPTFIPQKRVSQEIDLVSPSTKQVPNPLSNDPELSLFLMAVENQRLTRQNQNHKTQNDALSSQYFQLQNQFQMMRNEDQDQRQKYLELENKYNQQLHQQDEETEFWKEKYASQDQGLSIRLEQTLKKLYESENSLNDLKENYNQMIRRKDMEIQDQKQQIETRRQSMLNREIRELTIKFQADKTQLNAENNRLKDVLDLRQQEIDEWTQNYQQLEQTLNNLKNSDMRTFELEQRVSTLNKELEMANYNLNVKNQQVEQIKNQNRDFELQLSGQKKEFQEGLRRKDQECMEESIRSSNLRKELDNLRIFEIKFKECDEKRNLLYSENQRLNQILQERIKQLESISKDHTLSSVEQKKLETSNKSYQDRIQLLTAELERVNLILQQKADEISQVKGSNYNFQHENQQLKAQENESSQRIEWLLKELNSFKLKLQDMDSLNSKVIVYEQKISGNEEKLIILGQEIERLNGTIRYLNQENEKMKQAQQNSEQQILHYRDFEKQCSQYEKHMEMLGQEIDRLKVSLHEKVRENDNLKHQNYILNQQEYNYREASKAKESEEVIYSLRRDLESHQMELREMYNLKILVDDKDSKLLLLSQEIERLNSVIQQKVVQAENSRQHLYSIQVDNENLRQQLESIQFLSEEIDRLNEIVKEKDTELSQWRQKYVEYNSLHNRVKDDLSLFVILFAEIESLRNRVQHKENELDNLRRSQIASIIKR